MRNKMKKKNIGDTKKEGNSVAFSGATLSPSPFPVVTKRLTCRGSRRILSVSCDPWRGAKPIRGDRSSSPFSHGSRACSLFSCCEAEMFFSSSLIYFVMLFSASSGAIHHFWAAKLRISFELPKNYAFFHEKFYVFFHFLRNFAAENGSFCKKDIHITNHITL